MTAPGWTGRVDVDAGYTGRWHQEITPFSGQSSGVALLGFPVDAGVRRNHGRPGAADGPAALRAALANVPLPRPLALYDAGDVDAHGDDLEAAQADYAGRVTELLRSGVLPIGLGGGHEIAWGTWQGLAATLPAAPKVGVLNIDAHLDLRAAPHATSGTPFRQIAEDCAARGWTFRYACLGASRFANTAALFDRAAALGAHVVLDEALPTPEDAADALTAWLAGLDHLYLTICLDALPPDLAPGVSAPSARGLPMAVVEAIVDLALASGALRVADIAELNPRFDIDHRTARVAARLVARLAHGAIG
jgi:formiminoglutamase